MDGSGQWPGSGGCEDLCECRGLPGEPLGFHRGVEAWYLALCGSDPETADLVEDAIDQLADEGPAPRRPLADRVNSQIAVVSALTADPDGSAILVPKNSPIHSVAQLRGKSIAVAQGSSANYHLLAILTKAGLTIKDVTADYLQPAEAQAAFAAGHVAAWDVWSPFIEQAEAQDHARVLANGASIGQTYGFEVASRAALANPSKAAAIRDYLALLAQAYTWATTHQSAWATTWAQATGLPLSVMTQAVKDDQPKPTAITPPVLSSEQTVANAFTSAGLIPGHVDFNNFAVTSFNGTFGASS